MRQKVILRKAQTTSPIHCSELVVTCAGGLEDAVARELGALGFDTTGRDAGVVRCGAALEDSVRLNRELRIASRVLVPVKRFRVPDFDALYRCVKEIPWDRIIPVATTFAVTALTRSRKMSDHRFLAMKVKDAIVDRQRSASGGKRSSVDRNNPLFRVNVFVQDTGDTEISLDASGDPLHQRGYRTEAGDAPLRETVAAAMLSEAGFATEASTNAEAGTNAETRGSKGVGLLIDPFCGSGTIAIEAALIAAGISPHGSDRKFAVERWPWFRRATMVPAKDTATVTPVPTEPPPRIVAADSDPAMVAIARRNARRAGVEEMIEFRVAHVGETLKHPLTPGAGGRVVVVTNPPYGERLKPPDLKRLYTDLGSLLKRGIPGGSAFVLCPDPALMRLTGLRPSRRTPLYNGGLACTLYRFVLRDPM